MRFKVFAGAALLALASSFLAIPSSGAVSGNPLAGAHFGIDTDKWNYVYPAWKSATGTNKTLLARIALQPRMIMVGPWTAHQPDVRTRVAGLVAEQQAGDRTKIVEFSTFNLWPKGESVAAVPSTYPAAYRSWYQGFVQGIGSARAVVVLEDDLPLSVSNNLSPGVRESLTRYAAQLLSQHSNITTYIDAGDSDWLTVPRAAQMLRAAGVQYVRGFALGSTHYAPVGPGVTYGSQVVASLASLGIRGKHFVMDTVDNGRGFTWAQWQQYRSGQWFDNAMPCTRTYHWPCTALGIPPTTDVANLRWGLTAAQRSLAAAHIDAYLWYGRPWLYGQAAPFDMNKALGVAAAARFPNG